MGLADSFDDRRAGRGRSLTVRLSAWCVGAELPYAFLIAITFLRVVAIQRPADLWTAIGLIAIVHVLKASALVALCAKFCRPIERWRAPAAGPTAPRPATAGSAPPAFGGSAPGPRSVELLRRAGQAAYEAPLRLAACWSVLWLLAYLPVAAVLGARSGPLSPLSAIWLFSLGLFCAALPLAYGIIAQLLLPVSGRISNEAREQGVAVPGRAFSLRARLVILALCLAAAPTSWMASLLILEGQRAIDSLTIALFALVPVVWAPACAALLATVVATPFRRVGGAIEQIIQSGDVESLERLPVYSKDELGALAEGVNTMADRLASSSRRIREYIAERERHVSELMEMDRFKDQFIKVAAHELKTPVAITKGYALALRRAASDLTPAQRSMLDAVARGADRLERIVDDLLAVSQVALGLAAPSSDPLELRALVEETVASLPASARRRVQLEAAPESPLVVRGDDARLRQVVLGLLDNALKYSPAGGEVHVRVAREPGAEALVSVRDHGVGIPAGKRARIFELFFRAHTDTPHDYGGMGVGLYLAKSVITRQEGRLWFESTENEGTTFSFTLPLVEAG
jgi:signal transduction histidine kinase